MVKLCAKCRSENNLGGARKIVLSGLTFQVSTGLFLTLLSFFMAAFIASIINKPESVFLISVASLIIFSNSLLVAPHSAFIGFERMDLYVLIMIGQASITCVLAPLLVYLGYGAFGALIGYFLGFLIAGLLSIGLLYIVILRKIEPVKNRLNISEMFFTLKSMLKFGILSLLVLFWAGYYHSSIRL